MHNAFKGAVGRGAPILLGQFDFSGSVLDDMPSRSFFPAASASRRSPSHVRIPRHDGFAALPAAWAMAAAAMPGPRSVPSSRSANEPG